MGSFEVHLPSSAAETRRFTRDALGDLEALEALLSSGTFESSPVRMGVEQEMYLIEERPPHRPLSIAAEVLRELADPDVTSELALFNLEINLPPAILEGGFLERLEQSLQTRIGRIDDAAAAHGGCVLLTGMLPGLRRRDLSPDHMTPEVRYRDLDKAFRRYRGGSFRISIRGIDEFEQRFESIMVEAANCSLQLHLQVDPARFADLYNLAQLISAPLLAAATNSPILLGHRLWHETRVALFEASVDSRTTSEMTRGAPRRVTFGAGWLRSSALELFRESLLRFRVLLVASSDAGDPDRTPPDLRSISLHSGTIWRWNRACYGTSAGRPHLRIENRVLPAGPTVLDEVSNAALFYGLMEGLAGEASEIGRLMPFDTARANFVKAARHGVDASLEWLDGEPHSARDLLLDQLIPAARRGLQALGCTSEEIARYLGTVEARVERRRCGSHWLLRAVGNDARRREACLEAASGALLEGQRSGTPVHQWPAIDPATFATDGHRATVRSIMTRDLLTLRPDDAAELATCLMRWCSVHHVPVENDAGEVVGLVTADSVASDLPPDASVGDLMDASAPRVDPETSVAEAASVIRSTGATCLLVVAEGGLLGIATDTDIGEAMTEAPT